MKQKKFFLHVVLFTILAVTAVRTYGQDTIATTTAPLPDNEKGLSGNLLTGTGTRTTASNNFDVNFYRCEWEIDPTIRFIKGKVTAYFTVTSATDKLVFDLSNVLTVDSVYYRGSTLSFQQTANDALELQFPVPFKGGYKDSVSIFYNGIPRNPASFKPFVQSSHSGSPIIYTLSEPFGAKEWWPCKNGLDDKADSIDVYITNPAVYQASSNGVMVDELLQNNTRISHWKHRYPIASYLVAMAVTNYAVLKDTMMVGGKPMDLIDYAYPESVAYFNQQHAYTKYTLNLYAKLFGDYPFAKEKYGFTQFNAGGGMEHQTNTFVIGPTVQLIAHESAHQWFGDKITCASWEDIWLNEGFATYCEVLYNESIDKNLIYQMLRNYTASIISAPDGSVRVDDTTSASRIFNGRLSYYKGAYLLHMLRWKLGDTVFFNGLRRYLNDPLLKYNHAKTADLQRNLEEESKQTLSSYFQNWFSNQGYPMYALEWMQDSSNNIAAKINQATSHTSVSFFDMPVPVRFKNSTRDTIIVFNHTKNGQIFISNPGFKADTAIFDPLLWLLCTSTTKQVSCIANAGNDESFPAYNIKWTQNANNWIYADVNQINPAASIATDIPLYLHFATNGHDTTIVLKNIGSHYSTWINAGFKATSIFVTTSCLLSNNYTISSQPSNQITNEVKLYPVPVTANNLNLSLKSPSDKHLSVTIFNTAGQLMYQRKLDTPGKDELFFIPVNNLAKGIYVIRLESEAAIKISKSIIKIF